ncbi:MAG: response regulator transcription factor [Sulfurovaceae bacterium]|nr:response regulator transcription factor [Sulfurovaceae bacterium]
MNSFKLLYIEDDKDIQEIYLNLLQEYVGEIHCANDGEEGYQKYLEIKPDIILLDINMPKIDGLTLAKKIREIDKDVKIIITTSYSEREKLLQAIELYLIKYIIKPIEPDILKDAMTKAITEIEKEQGKLFYFDTITTWNTTTQQLIENGTEIRLTKNERRFLMLISSNPSKVYTFFEIFDYLSYDDFDKEYDANQIRALVKLVRKKVPKDAIINIYGEGYRFNPLSKY